MRALEDDRYSSVAKLLHWLIAALLIANILLAWRMGGTRTATTYAVFQLHKSIGITVLLLTLARIGWRIAHRPPPLSGHLARWERWLAHAVHGLFYLLMLGLPLTGWLLVSTSRTGIPTLLYGLVPWPHLPVAAAAKPLAHEIGEVGHGLLARLAYVTILLHVAGALKHQWIDRDGELGRMLPGPRRSRPLDPRLVGLAVAFAALVAAAETYPWGARPAVAPAPVPAPAEPTSPERTAAPAPQMPTPAKEADAPPKAPAPTPAEPARWTVDAARSTLSFSAQWNGAAVNGRFARWTADILFDPDALDRSRISASIDLASVTSDNGDAAGALPGADFFDVANHPRATFTAERFTALGGGRYRAAGTLTLRGMSRPVTVRFSPGISGDTATMTGSATLQRTAFGVGQGEWSATDQIADAVSVAIAIKARRAR